MSKQTFIICLEDEKGVAAEFERWGFKKAETCIEHMVELYGTYPSLYLRNLDRAAKVVCYPTPDGYHKADPVWSVTPAEFLGLIEEWNEKRAAAREGERS